MLTSPLARIYKLFCLELLEQVSLCCCPPARFKPCTSVEYITNVKHPLSMGIHGCLTLTLANRNLTQRKPNKRSLRQHKPRSTRVKCKERTNNRKRATSLIDPQTRSRMLRSQEIRQTEEEKRQRQEEKHQQDRRVRP